MTAPEIAKYLHVHISTIWRLLKAKQLPAFRMGSEWRFHRQDIDRWRLGRHAETASKRQ